MHPPIRCETAITHNRLIAHLYIATNVVFFFCRIGDTFAAGRPGHHAWRALKGGGDEDDENVDAEAT